MKKYNLLLILLLTLQSIAGVDIITQGDIIVSTDDLDGFAYKIPEDTRKGFFESPVRVEKTLFSILNMKHIIQHGKAHNLIDEKLASSNITNRLNELFPAEDGVYTMVQEKRVNLVAAFLKKEEYYKQIQQNMTESIIEDELIELAEEKYIVNKSTYIIDETRTIDFILVVYNQKNKKEQYYKALDILNLIKTKGATFAELQDKYKNSEVDIETTTLSDFRYNKKNVNLSNKLFSNKKIGIYDKLIDSNQRFSIAKITKINKAKQLTFDDVKVDILKDLKQKNAEKKFNTLLISLTKDKLKVNEEILGTLRSRYK